MAKLYYHFGSMNCGKSAALLQVAHNYKERGMRVALFTYAGDGRFGYGNISSRTGLTSPANLFSKGYDIYDEVLRMNRSTVTGQGEVSCVLVDEAQFLTEDQVYQLCEIVDVLGIPVMSYGIRTDFQGNLFEGSSALFSRADKIVELKTICHCGDKSTMILRTDSETGEVIRSGPQKQIGGNESYVSVCRKHFKEGIAQ